MNEGISIIICCYNSITRLEATLRHLVSQYTNEKFLHEIIIIDNNSIDNTAEFAQNIWKKLKSNIPLRIVFEKQQGLSFARKTGIFTAKYEYIIFCDDDNWFNPNYILTVFNIFKKDKTIGIIGGVGNPVCEIPPPKWFKKLNGSYYACGKLYKKNGIVTTPTGVVYGAGMAIRKSVFMNMILNGFSFTLSGRKENSSLMGEEIELGLMFRILGYTVWYDTSLTFKHFLPQRRLKWSSFKSLRSSYGLALPYLYPYQHELLNKPKTKFFYYKWLLKQQIKSILLISYHLVTGNFLKRQFGISQFIANFKAKLSFHEYLQRRNQINTIKQKILNTI
jgi:glycosyltransferase involved in cell wall biosynthesis